MKKCTKMYENKHKNIKTTGINDLDKLLQLFADLDEPIELYALGGTAMVLKEIKEATKDIDFMTTSKYKNIKRLFELAGLKEQSSSKICNIWRLNEIRLDVFYEESIMGITLPDDWKQLSEHVKDIGKVKLFILNWYDIIISKIARSEERDIQDCIAIIKFQKINISKLKERYYRIAETSLI